jgi:hypothetical protein
VRSARSWGQIDVIMNDQTANDHLTDDDLVLHYYGEMSAVEESAAVSHLRSCDACRQDYTVLQRVLGSVDESALSDVDLPPSFERTVWARLAPSLRRERRGWMSWLVVSPAPLGLAAAVLVLVGAAFFAGRALSPAPVPAPAAPAAAASADQIRERIFLVDLGEHLERSQMVLVELVSSGETASADISEERIQAEQLVADNRLYRQTAEDTGNTTLTDLLDEIDRVLTELAAGPEQLSARDLADIRGRIESRDLLFKVRVISSEVRERQKESVRRRSQPRS